MKDLKKIQEDGRVFIDMPEKNNPCFNCGVCCTHFRISFYCGEMDTQPLGFVPSELTSKINDVMVCMKGTEKGENRCVALQGNIGMGDIKCGIYDKRPTPCREFPVWMDDGSVNPKCNELRRKYGIPEFA